jgi:hypothetical protein
MWKATRPVIQIKRVTDGTYKWFLYLSNNKRKPTCVSPTAYKDAFKARDRAKKFALKFKEPMRLVDRENAIDEIIIIDETKGQSMPDWMTDEE